MGVLSYFKIIRKRKTLTRLEQNLNNNNNEKLWKIYELSSIGISVTLGFGVYILIGHITHQLAGPSAIISFLIAALVGLFAALCYIEIGHRIQKNGSTFTYNYVIIGELLAFIIGWTIILEYLIGVACVSRSFSLYFDNLIDNALKNKFTEITSIDWIYFGTYFDLLALLLPIVFSVILAIGLKRHAIVITVFTIVNIAFICFLVVLGLIKANISNWRINSTTIVTNETIGDGGFLPFDGINGTMKAAALCVFCFIGCDCLATTINSTTITETKKRYPISVFISFFTLFIIFSTVSIVLTLMWPYYLQSSDAWLPLVFEDMGWSYAKWIVTIGALICLVTSLFSFFYALLPIINTMTADGLLYKFLGKMSFKSEIPVIGILLSGVISGILAGLFNINQLIQMLSIGTLLAFISVSVCIILIRFSKESFNGTSDSYIGITSQNISCMSCITQTFTCKYKKPPTRFSEIIVRILLIIFILISIGLALMLRFSHENIFAGDTFSVTLSIILLFLLILIVILIATQPRQIDDDVYFKLPLVPLTPLISIFINIYLIVMLDVASFIRFGIWLIFGLIIYFSNICLRDQKVKKQSVIQSTTISSEENINNGTLKSIRSDENRNGTVINKEIVKSELFIETNEINKVEDKLLEKVNENKSNTVVTSNSINYDDELNKNQKSIILPGSIKSLKKVKAPLPPIIPIVLDEKQRNDQEIINADNFDIESQNSSNKSSHNDINLISEVESSLTEKKEPNGNTYFVDEFKESSKFSPRTAERETSSAIAILDDIIQDEEARPKSILLEEQEVVDDIIPILTAVVVHQEDTNRDLEEPKEIINEEIRIKDEIVENISIPIETEDEINSAQVEDGIDFIIPIPPPLPNLLVSPSMAKKSESNNISKQKLTPLVPIVSMVEDSKSISEIEKNKTIEKSGKTEEFMKRLTILLGEKSKTNVIKPSIQNVKLKEQNDDIPVQHQASIQKSKSENNVRNALLKEIQLHADFENENSIENQKPTNETEKRTELRRVSSVPHVEHLTNNINNVELPTSPIPEAPRFDPVLYKSLGRNSQFNKLVNINLNQNKTDEFKVKSPPLQKRDIPLSSSDDDDDKTNMKSIKERLEMIFQRGPPPIHFPKTKVFIDVEPEIEVNFKSNSDIKVTPATDNELEDKFSKPFDTVKLQKLRFSDVLKSIKEDTKPSVIRNSSFKKNDLESMTF